MPEVAAPDMLAVVDMIVVVVGMIVVVVVVVVVATDSCCCPSYQHSFQMIGVVCGPSAYSCEATVRA